MIMVNIQQQMQTEGVTNGLGISIVSYSNRSDGRFCRSDYFSISCSIVWQNHGFTTNRKVKTPVEEKQIETFVADSSEKLSMEVEDGISEEVVAAIAAAVAVMMSSDGKAYQLRSIKRTGKNRPAWSIAGIQDNTRPF